MQVSISCCGVLLSTPSLSVWLTTQQLHSSVPFLPVNPSLSPMRNQARQKLATLDAKEFTHLVIDILLDANRRQNISLETGKKSHNILGSVCSVFLGLSVLACNVFSFGTFRTAVRHCGACDWRHDA